MSEIVILQTIPEPPLHVSGDSLVLRGFYSQRYLDSDGVTAVMPGNGISGFYYTVTCTTDGDGNLVIPEHTIHTTDDGVDIITSLYVGQLFIDDVADVIIFGNPTGGGWIIPASLGASTTWDQLDVFNQGAYQLGSTYPFYLTAAATVALIQSIPKGDSGYSGYSGVSGFSGVSGYSGYSGRSGYSGYSGSGVSGFSGYSGTSGYSGKSGFSGTSGYSGFSGVSGYSGFSGRSGYSGYSGYSGFSGV